MVDETKPTVADAADILASLREQALRSNCRRNGGCRPGARCREHRNAEPQPLGDLLDVQWRQP